MNNQNLHNSFWKNPEEASGFFDIESSERKTLLPHIAAIINKLDPSNVLDYGCGDGYVHKLLRKEIKKLLFDINEDLLKKVLTTLAHYNCTASFKPLDIPEQSFDLVLLSLVLVCVPKITDQKEILRTVKTKLRAGGKLVFVMPHPCFRQYSFRPFHTSFLHEPFDYMQEGTHFKVYMHESPVKPVAITDFHYTLSSVLNMFTEMGFVMDDFQEVQDMDLGDGQLYNQLFPPFIIIIYSLNNSI